MPAVVLLFPGQGSQAVGMAAEFVRERPAAAALAERADRLLGRPIWPLVLRGPLAALTRTENQQVAVCLAEAVCLLGLGEAGLPAAVAVAGHSLGELTACYAACVLDFDQLIRLAAERGRLMQRAADAAPGAMLALSPASEADADRLAARAGAVGPVAVASVNAPGQVVLSGPAEALAEAERLARGAGIRATWLPVGGPWHSPAMAPAARAFAEVLAAAPLRDAAVPVWGGLDARPERRAAALKARLARQIDRPVRWDTTMRALRAAHPDAVYLEVGPGKVLAGLMRAIDPRCRVWRVDGPATLAAAGAAVAAGGDPAPASRERA